MDHTNITGDSIALTANTKVDSQSLAMLTSEQGPLHCGVLPGVDCTSAEGEKAVWQAIGQNPVSKIKKEKQEREPAEQVTPKTPKEKAVAFLPEILTKSADARKMALSLKHVEYGGELLSQLMSSSSKMEKLHEKLNDLVTRSVDDDSKYIKLCDIAEKEMKWFDKAKAAGRSLLNGLYPKAKAKGKAKAKTSAKPSRSDAGDSVATGA